MAATNGSISVDITAYGFVGYFTALLVTIPHIWDQMVGL
jgi:hypothetical protein